MHLVETRNLTHVYRGDIPALGGVDFIAGRKSRIAVIGPNGAGKSTLFSTSTAYSNRRPARSWSGANR